MNNDILVIAPTELVRIIWKLLFWYLICQKDVKTGVILTSRSSLHLTGGGILESILNAYKLNFMFRLQQHIN